MYVGRRQRGNYTIPRLSPIKKLIRSKVSRINFVFKRMNPIFGVRKKAFIKISITL